jgi:hypothetical protein
LRRGRRQSIADDYLRFLQDAPQMILSQEALGETVWSIDKPTVVFINSSVIYHIHLTRKSRTQVDSSSALES